MRGGDVDDFNLWLRQTLSVSGGGNFVRLDAIDFPQLMTPEQAEQMAEMLDALAAQARRNRTDANPGLYEKGKRP